MNTIPLWLDLRAASTACVAAAKQTDLVQFDALVENNITDSDGVAIAKLIAINSKADEDLAATATGRVVIDGKDWTIIPLENLIAARRNQPDSLYALARSVAEVKLFRDVLDVGVHGIVLAPQQPQDIQDALALLASAGPRQDDAGTEESPSILLQPATITQVMPELTGDRVCIDCTTNFEDGTGLLVGDTARGFALVHAETIQSEYVNARPFRVNAGAVHCYVMTPGNRTRYLSELRGGDQVLSVGATPNPATIGRVKIERRPHTRVSWNGGSVTVQTAETIRFVQPSGAVISVTELVPGDEIMVHHESDARHFGMPIDERLVER